MYLLKCSRIHFGISVLKIHAWWFHPSPDWTKKSGLYRILPCTCCTWLYFHCRCYCNIYLYPYDGIYRPGCVKACAWWYVWAYADPSDPLFRSEYEWLYHESLHKWYRYPAPDDQSGNPTGTDVIFHHHCYVYFHAGLKSPADTACHCCHRDSGICHKKNRWKQWKILCAPAGFPCRRDRICGRTYEWPACGKSVQPWAEIQRGIRPAQRSTVWQCLTGKQIRKHDGTGYRKYRKFTIRADCCSRWCSLGCRCGRHYARRHGLLPAVYQEFYPAVYAGGTAVQLHRYGSGRSW